MVQPDFEDAIVDFGAARFWHGTAFLNDSRPKSPSDPGAVRVGKQWNKNGTGFILVESIEYKECSSQLAKLPEHGKGNGKNGFRIDYSIITSSTSIPTTFNSGTTYWVRPSPSNPNQSGGFGFGGTVTFQTGAIIKYNKNSYLYFYGPVSVTGTSGNVIFTAADDNSIGESVSSSALSGQYASQAFYSYYNINYVYLSKLQFRYCQIGIRVDANSGQATSHTFDNCRFESCGTAVYSGPPCTVTLNSPTFAAVGLSSTGGGTTYINSLFYDYGSLSTDGADGTLYSDTLIAPPDTTGAVGSTKVVEVVNGAIRVIDKSSLSLIESQSSLTFWGIDHVFDAKIVYDPTSDRWFMTGLSSANSGIVLFAYTTGSSPTPLSTSWVKQAISIQATANNGDLPCMSVDANGIYISVAYDVPHEGHHRIFAINKSVLFSSGFSAACYPVSNPDGSIAADVIQPVTNFDSIGGSGYTWFVTKADPVSPQGGQIFYRRLSWSGGGPGWVGNEDWQPLLTTLQGGRDYFDLGGISHTWGPPQPNLLNGSAANRIQLFETGSRLSQAYIKNSRLFVSHSIGINTSGGAYDLNVNGGVIDRTGIQWYRGELSGSTTLTSATFGRIYSSASTPMWYIFPSVAGNASGDMVFGFSGANESTRPAAFFSSVKYGSTTSSIPICFRSATESSVDLFGDYSCTISDPNSSGTFWTFQQFAWPDMEFGTRVQRIHLP